MPIARIAEWRRNQLLVQLTGAVVALVKLISDDSEEDESLLEQINDLVTRAQHIEEMIRPPPPGRGSCEWRLVQLQQPKNTMYEFCVDREERFVELVRFTPKEFEDLHDDVEEVMLRTRNHTGTFTDAENQLRRKRHFKYSSRERLFHFLWLLKNYPVVTEGANATNLCRAAVYVDFVWLRSQLSTHPILVAECHWPAPEDLERQRVSLVNAGLLETPFDQCVFMCDGTKDLGRRTNHYNRRHEPDYSQKGNGKSHLLV